MMILYHILIGHKNVLLIESITFNKIIVKYIAFEWRIVGIVMIIRSWLSNAVRIVRPIRTSLGIRNGSTLNSLISVRLIVSSKEKDRKVYTQYYRHQKPCTWWAHQNNLDKKLKKFVCQQRYKWKDYFSENWIFWDLYIQYSYLFKADGKSMA
jgi:hypothetical protein